MVHKKGETKDLRDFIPINLVGGLYQLLVKVLANRLKKVVGKVVSSSQNAFVYGRQILDAVLIANKAVDVGNLGLLHSYALDSVRCMYHNG